MLKLLTFLAGIAALGLAVLSIGANFWFGTLLTSGEERWLYGAVFGLLDSLKTVLPVLAASAFTAGLVAKGRVAVLIFILLSLLSFTAEIGLYATTKSEVVGDASAAHVRYQEAKAAKEKAESDLAALGQLRPTGEIEGEIRSLKRDRLFDRSKQCSDATAPESRDLCARLDRLEGELKKVSEADDWRQKIDDEAAKISKMDVAAALRAIDPQAEALAKLISLVVTVEAESVRTALAVLIALLIELGSGLGPWLAAPASAVARTSTKEAPITVQDAATAEDPELPAESSAAAAGDDIVRRWATASVVKRKGSFIPAGELRASFEAWCATENLPPLNATAFGKAMTSLGFERRKKSGGMRYEGVALRPVAHLAPALRLAVDNQRSPRRALGVMVTTARA